MFGVTGTGLAAIKSYQNGGKNPRYSVDQWDKVRQPEHPFPNPKLINLPPIAKFVNLRVMVRPH